MHVVSINITLIFNDHEIYVVVGTHMFRKVLYFVFFN
jgi:hypothetical protein